MSGGSWRLFNLLRDMSTRTCLFKSSGRGWMICAAALSSQIQACPQHTSLNTDLPKLITLTQTLDMTSKCLNVDGVSIISRCWLHTYCNLLCPVNTFSVFWLDLCQNHNLPLPWLVGTKNLYIRYELSAFLTLLPRAAFVSVKGLCTSSFKTPNSTAYVRLESYFRIDANRPGHVYDIRIQIWFVYYHDLE